MLCTSASATWLSFCLGRSRYKNWTGTTGADRRSRAAEATVYACMSHPGVQGAAYDRGSRKELLISAPLDIYKLNHIEAYIYVPIFIRLRMLE